MFNGVPPLKLDVTFRVDDFSYKKLFHPSTYAKVTPTFTNSREILQKSRKFMFVNFPAQKQVMRLVSAAIVLGFSWPRFRASHSYRTLCLKAARASASGQSTM